MLKIIMPPKKSAITKNWFVRDNLGEQEQTCTRVSNKCQCKLCLNDLAFFNVILQVQCILQDVGSNIATPRQSSPDRNISENGFFFAIFRVTVVLKRN